MEKINNITPATCDIVRSEMEQALNLITAKYGLNINIGNMRYTNNTIDVKVGLNVIYANAKTAEEIYFIEKGFMYGFEKEDLGKEFMEKGKHFKIVGLKSGRNLKYQVLCKCVGTGQQYKFAASYVKGLIQ
jgi:hypothetical protein